MLKAYELPNGREKAKKDRRRSLRGPIGDTSTLLRRLGRVSRAVERTPSSSPWMDGRREQKRELLELLRGEPARTNLFNTFQSVDSRKQILLWLG
jgi:hypothetical protein